MSISSKFKLAGALIVGTALVALAVAFPTKKQFVVNQDFDIDYSGEGSAFKESDKVHIIKMTEHAFGAVKFLDVGYGVKFADGSPMLQAPAPFTTSSSIKQVSVLGGDLRFLDDGKNEDLVSEYNADVNAAKIMMRREFGVNPAGLYAKYLSDSKDLLARDAVQDQIGFEETVSKLSEMSIVEHGGKETPYYSTKFPADSQVHAKKIYKLDVDGKEALLTVSPDEMQLKETVHLSKGKSITFIHTVRPGSEEEGHRPQISAKAVIAEDVLGSADKEIVLGLAIPAAHSAGSFMDTLRTLTKGQAEAAASYKEKPVQPKTDKGLVSLSRASYNFE